MPVVKLVSVPLLCVFIVAGCRSEAPSCPVGTPSVDPVRIPDGSNQATVVVSVSDPLPNNGLTVVTEVTADIGSIAGPFPPEMTYTYSCPFDFAGEAEICVETTYGAEEDASRLGLGEKLRGPNVYLDDPLECSTTRCTVVTCPEVKNICPTVTSLIVDPTELSEGQAADIEVVASDPDDNPGALVTTLSAKYGTIADPSATSTSYQCDPDIGGIIEICVVASDGDPQCDVERCTGVRCPGEPLENTCPIIESVSADPVEIPVGETTSTVSADAYDPDEYPAPLRVEWTVQTGGGAFADRFASQTTFTCGSPGPVTICARANDGDVQCSVRSCLTIQCPSEIPANVCPQLFVINSTQRRIPPGQTSTDVQTRAQDLDGLPQPLTLTLGALWGVLENTENIQKDFSVVEQNATYICDRPGPVEVCVDATDGACTKTLCDVLTCPDTIPSP